LKLIRLSRE